MGYRIRVLGLAAAVWLSVGTDLLACGDKFLVSGRGTRYQRPKNARAAAVVIYSDATSSFPATVGSVPVASVLKREGHRLTTVQTLEQLAAILAGGRFDVVLAVTSVVPSIEELLEGIQGAPVVVALCVKGLPLPQAETTAPCAVKTPIKQRSLLEAIDNAVLTHDKNIRKIRLGG